jgi:IS5 family transposase
MFGSTLQVTGGARPNIGRIRLPKWLMMALLMLKHTYRENNESVVERWAQDVYFQYFRGRTILKPGSLAISRRLAQG